ATLHRGHGMVSQVLHEHAASLSAETHANRSRRLIKCAKDSGHYLGYRCRARRRRTAGTAAKSGPCAAALWLPAPARPTATGGLYGEPQTPVPALSRGAPHGPPAGWSQAGLGHTGTDAGPAMAERPLVAGFW